MTTITKEIASRVLETVDAGLVHGMGKPVPGQMCVEAAVCYAMGLPHGDDPSCVSRAVRALKIALNDSPWSSPTTRAKGMRRLALVQLGSAGVINDEEFAKRVAVLAIKTTVPAALRAAASIQPDEHHKGALLDAALHCEREGTQEAANAAAEASAAARAASAAWAAAWAASMASAAWAAAAAARAAAWAANAAARAAADAARAAARAAAWAANASKDKALSDFAEGVVQILIEMNAPGVQWLPLTE